MLSQTMENFPTMINGLTIVVDRTGRINISDMIKKSGSEKRPYDWRRNKSSQQFIEETARRVNMTEDDVYYSHRGTGIWAHPFIALKIAGWISPAFDVSMMDIIFRYQRGDKSIVSEVLNISDVQNNTITNLVSIAPADSSQKRKTVVSVQNVSDMSDRQIEQQRQLNERLPDLLNMCELPLNDDNTIDMLAIENMSSESVLLNVVSCSRSGIKTYADVVDSTKEQIALMYNERIEIDNEAKTEIAARNAEIEHLRAVIAQLVVQIDNTISVPIADDSLDEFLNITRNGSYLQMVDDYGEHLRLLRTTMMDITLSKNCIEKEQLSIVLSILKTILMPNLSVELPYPIECALADTSASPSYFQKNAISFEDEDGNIGVYDTFELMGLDRPEIMKRVCSLPNEWKAMMIARLNCSVIKPQFNNSATHIFIYVGYSAIIPTKKDLYIEFHTERLSSPGLSYMVYVGESHLNKSAGEFISAIGGETKIQHRAIAELMQPHSNVSVIMSSNGLLHLM